MKLPQGWSEDDGHLSHLLVLKHERMGWMSIDLEKRIFSPGMGQPRIWRPTTTYSGRGWKDRIVADAIAYAESVFGGSAAQKHDPGTPAPLTPEGETT